jgi:molecular chaperone GrpE
MADEQNENPEEPIIRDKRKIDPETGEARSQSDSDTDGAAAEAGAPEAAVDAEDATVGAVEDELTVEDILNAAPDDDAEEATVESPYLEDLRRVTAEYANYRKRTEANRIVERERAVGETVKGLLPVLDDIDRAEKHGDLVEGSVFAQVAAKLRTATSRLGLEPFGDTGEAFDPTRHEAIFQAPSDDVTEPSVGDVVEKGYTLGSTLLRAAKVVVSVPSDG